MDNELQKHYAMLLGIGSPWEVKTVELKLQEKGYSGDFMATKAEHLVKT